MEHQLTLLFLGAGSSAKYADVSSSSMPSSTGGVPNRLPTAGALVLSWGGEGVPREGARDSPFIPHTPLLPKLEPPAGDKPGDTIDSVRRRWHWLLSIHSISYTWVHTCVYICQQYQHMIHKSDCQPWLGWSASHMEACPPRPTHPCCYSAWHWSGVLH